MLRGKKSFLVEIRPLHSSSSFSKHRFETERKPIKSLLLFLLKENAFEVSCSVPLGPHPGLVSV